MMSYLRMDDDADPSRMSVRNEKGATMIQKSCGRSNRVIARRTTRQHQVWLTTISLVLFGTILCLGRLTSANSDENNDDSFVCGVWLAPSTLPGTGLGMYAGAKGYTKDEMITKLLGDHVVSIPDFKMTHSDTGLYDRNSEDMTKYFLWDQYTWNPAAFGIHFNHISSHDIEIASPGFGAAANSFMDFVNVHEGGTDFGLLHDDDHNYTIHRSKDPGAGAFTPFHTRKAWAKKDIEPHSEFFVSYGNDWFTDRAWRLGTIPVSGDHDKAEHFWRTFNHRFLGRDVFDEEEDEETEDTNSQKSEKAKTPADPVEEDLKAIHREFWDSIVADYSRSAWSESRIMASLPTDPHSEFYESMLSTPGGYIVAKQNTMKRDPQWLQEHGTCADAVRIGRSTLPNQQAGHGAFANTRFQEGQVIMGAPLIHIKDKAIFDTYFKHSTQDKFYEETPEDDQEFHKSLEDLDFDEYEKETIHKYDLNIGYQKTGEQLLLNYVFGHRDSTMMLSPYGPGVQLINHNQTLANCKLQWADPKRSNHHPELLEKSVDYINNEFPLGSVLGLEIVATKDIAPNQELFLDYGDEWEQAWQKHVKEWKPTKGADQYVSAIDLNTLPQYANKPIPNWHGGKNDPSPFPRMVRLTMSNAWRDSQLRDKKGDDSITENVMWESYDYEPVVGIYRTGLIQGTTEDKSSSSEADNSLYTVIVKAPNDNLSDEDMEKAKEAAEEEGTDLPTSQRIKVTNVPRRALKFEDLAYTQDQFLENAFREYIRIPDEIFPEAWKNIKTPEEKEAHYWRYRVLPWGTGPDGTGNRLFPEDEDEEEGQDNEEDDEQDYDEYNEEREFIRYEDDEDDEMLPENK